VSSAGAVASAGGLKEETWRQHDALYAGTIVANGVSGPGICARWRIEGKSGCAGGDSLRSAGGKRLTSILSSRCWPEIRGSIARGWYFQVGIINYKYLGSIG
jgi:hypothetical protein